MLYFSTWWYKAFPTVLVNWDRLSQEVLVLTCSELPVVGMKAPLMLWSLILEPLVSQKFDSQGFVSRKSDSKDVQTKTFETLRPKQPHDILFTKLVRFSIKENL